MKKVSWIWALGVGCVLAVMAVGCSGGGDSAADSRDALLAPVKEQKAALDAKRAEVADLQAQIAAAVVAEEGAADEEGAEADTGPTAEELQAQLNQAQSDVATMSEEFMAGLIGFLNSANMVEGEDPDAATLEGIRLKSSEDLLIAKEYIAKGGDYRRAIDIINTSLEIDPQNADLLDAKAQAEVDQYMTEERFALVVKGMTEAEVKARLGTPNPSNVRQYDDQDVVAWFYRREDKGAAGVYFQGKDDVLKVYKMDFNAVSTDEE